MKDNIEVVVVDSINNINNIDSQDIINCNSSYSSNRASNITIDKDTNSEKTSSSTLNSPSSTVVDTSMVYVDPRAKYSQKRKKLILFTIAFAGLIGPIGSTIYYPAMKVIERDLNTTSYLVNLSVSSFMVTMAVMPLAWGVFSDVYGRRRIYIVSLFISLVAGVGSALSNNIYLLLIFRAIQGIGCSSVNSVGAGTISDVFFQEERGSAMGVYYLGALVGPAVGPILGGVMTDYIGWKSIFWLLAIISLISFVMIFIFLPETKIPPPPGVEEPKKSLNPVKPLAYLRFKNIRLVICMVCLIYASYYSINIGLPNDYGDKYGFNSTYTGFMYFGVGLGNVLGSLYGGRYSDFMLKRSQKKLTLKKKGGVIPSEGRLKSIIPGLILFPVGLLCHGWSVNFVWPWYIPFISQFVVGFGMMFVFSSTSTYLVEQFPENSAAIMSVNNFSRFTVSTIAITVYQPIVEVIGTGWYFTAFTTFSLVAAIGTFWVYKNGERYRMKRKPWCDRKVPMTEIKVENNDDVKKVNKIENDNDELTENVNNDVSETKSIDKDEQTLNSVENITSNKIDSNNK